MSMTLEELKAQNAAEEAEDVPVVDEVVDQDVQTADELEAEPVEDEDEDEPGELSDDDADETNNEEPEWAKAADEGETEQAEKLFTGRDIKAAKTKLKAKLERRNTEIDDLRAELDQLKANPPAAQVSQSSSTEPKFDDFYDAEDPQAAFTKAYTDWRFANERAGWEAEQASNRATKQNEAAARDVDQAVEKHYAAAEVLAEKTPGIDADKYRSADLRVREVVESVFPDAGDVITDRLIANIGAGSEKVLYSLGVNDAKLFKLQSLLRADPNGIQAAIYLGELKASLNTPTKRKTNAPAPAANLKGDAAGGKSFSAMQKRYKSAHKSGDIQAAFDAKREAKKAGADTSNW